MELARQTVVKKRVAFSSIIASIFLVVIKLIVGIMTGSLGIISEAIHSTLDFGAALLTYFAVRVSDRPADTTYNYGYGKYESLSAFIETALLVTTSVWIIYKATVRLFVPREIEVTMLSFGVMILAIIIDTSRAWMLSKTAKKYDSQALEADALHFSSDILGSSVVIIGLIGAKYGIQEADPIAALVVGLLVLFASYRLGKKTISILLDKAPAGLAGQIGAEAAKIKGVVNVHSIRIRHASGKLFIDMHVNIHDSLPFIEVHNITEKVEKHVLRLGYDADVVVHAEPEEQVTLQNSGIKVPAQTARLSIAGILKSHGLRFHDLIIRRAARKCFIDFHLELPKDLSIAQAHDICDSIEADIKRSISPAIINIHVEPLKKPK